MTRTGRPTVAIVTQHYPPEAAACANRMDFFARALVDAGFDVQVFTATPSYPTGRTAEGYGGRPFRVEERDGVRVHLTWTYAHPVRSPARRLAAYLTFAAGSLRWLRRIGRADVVLFTSGPMFGGLVARLASRLYRRPMVLDVRDLWPDKIWESGARRPWPLERPLLRVLERRLYRRARVVFGATGGLCDELRRRVPAPTPVVLVRNTAQAPPGGILSPRPSAGTVRFVDSGTLGWMQDTASTCDAFASVRDAGVDAELVVAGWGPRGEEVRRRVEALEGARFLGPLPRARLHEELARCDVGIVSLAASSHNRFAVARRVFDYAAAGLAVVYAGKGEGAELVSSLGAGTVVPPGDAGALGEALLAMARDPARLAQAKAASGRLLEGELSDATVAARLVGEIARLTPGDREVGEGP